MDTGLVTRQRPIFAPLKLVSILNVFQPNPILPPAPLIQPYQKCVLALQTAKSSWGEGLGLGSTWVQSPVKRTLLPISRNTTAMVDRNSSKNQSLAMKYGQMLVLHHVTFHPHSTECEVERKKKPYMGYSSFECETAVVVTLETAGESKGTITPSLSI